jgi:hypothetical protein
LIEWRGTPDFNWLMLGIGKIAVAKKAEEPGA